MTRPAPARRIRPVQVSEVVAREVSFALDRLRYSARLYLTLARELDRGREALPDPRPRAGPRPCPASAQRGWRAAVSQFKKFRRLAYPSGASHSESKHSTAPNTNSGGQSW